MIMVHYDDDDHASALFLCIGRCGTQQDVVSEEEPRHLPGMGSLHVASGATEGMPHAASAAGELRSHRRRILLQRSISISPFRSPPVT